MITVNLNRNQGAKALYLQLYEQIKRMIIAKELVADEKLPSKKQLASHLKISVKTVENAYFQLALEGYIYSREKVGYFVSSIEGFYTARRSKRPSYVSHFAEDTYKLDIKANKTPEDMFPLSVWNRLARDIMADKGTELLHTVPFNGVADLRIAIARYLHGFLGLTVSPDQIVVGSGTEYLYRRIIHLLGHNTVVAMDDPGVSHVKTILNNDNIKYRCIPIDEDGIRPDLLAQTDATVLHVSPMHQFPLGITMPVQRRVELLQWVNAAPGRYIIEDDYNCEFLYQGNPVQPLFGMDVRRKVIYMNTFSKSIAPGIRVAYMVLPEVLMDKYIETLSFYSCTVPSSMQYQVARFISEGYLERYTHRVRQHNIGQRKMVTDTVESSPLSSHIELLRSPAGTHFLAKLRTMKSDQELNELLLAQGILASFVSQYCEARNPSLDHLLIINYSRITAKDMQFLLDELSEIL